MNRHLRGKRRAKAVTAAVGLASLTAAVVTSTVFWNETASATAARESTPATTATPPAPSPQATTAVPQATLQQAAVPSAAPAPAPAPAPVQPGTGGAPQATSSGS
jgi:hypothetical protein